MASSDEEPTSSDESDFEIEMGTQREFTVDQKDRTFLLFNANSTNLVTRRLPHLIVRTREGVLASAMIALRYYTDEMGVTVKAETWPATNRLFPATNKTEQIGDAYECTNADDTGTVTVYSREPMDSQYWVRELLGIMPNMGTDCWKANNAIGRCVRQLGIKTLEKLAPYFNTDPLSVLACLSRTKLPKVNFKGHVSHVFAKSLGDPNESVYVSPVSRSQLEGITLLRIDDTDYSLVSGKRVGYELVGEVFYVYEEGGSLRTIDDDALVGGTMR